MRSPDEVIATYERETVDFVPLVGLTINGVPVTDPEDVEVAVVGEWDRPETYVDAHARDGVIGFKLTGADLGRGVFKVFVRATREDLAPVINAGRIRLV
jgi:hypothetical protein